MRRALQLVLSLALSAFFLWLAFRQVDLPVVLQLLGTVDLPLVGLYVLSLVFIQLCRAWRWDLLIRPFARIPAAAVFRISNLGAMLVLLLPLRLGELARPYLLKKESGASMTATFGSVVVERTIDGLVVTLFFFVSTFLSGDAYHVPPALELAAVAALALFAVAMTWLVVTLLWHDTALAVTRAALSPLSDKLAAKVTTTLDKFVAGLRALPDAKAVLAVVTLTVALWVSNGLGFYAAMLAFGWELPVVAAFALVSVIVIGIMIPAGPGFLGTFQSAVLAGLAIYGVGANQATAYGLVIYPLNVLIVVGFGMPYLFTPKASMREIVSASAPEEAA